MKQNFLLFLLLSFVIYACSDLESLQNIEGIEVDAEYAFPLMDSRILMTDLIADFDDQANLLVDSDGSLRFFYRGDTTIRDSREIFDQINAVLPPLIPVFEPSNGFSVANASLDIDQVIFKEGDLEYTFFNPNSNSVTVTVTIPEMTKAGEPLSSTHVVGAFEALPLNKFDMAEVVLTPENDSFHINYEAITAVGEAVNLEQFFMLPKNFDYTYAEGLLGAQAFESDQDTLDFDYYDNWVGGNVRFQNPQVTLNIDNAFGFPAVAMAETFEVLTIDDQILPLQSPLIDNGFAFNYPRLDEIGAIKSTQFIFDRDNSNIVQVISAGPNAVVYDLDVVANPATNAKGFLTDSSYFSYSIDATFPLEGNISNFTINDTTTVDFSSYDLIESAEIKLVAENGIPLSTQLQAYFLDDKGTVLDSLFDKTSTIISAAATDNAGEVVNASEQVSFVPIDANTFDRIRTAKFLILSTSFSSPNNGESLTSIKENQFVAIRMGMKVKV
ncbi:MAG: hypothetical protein AAGI49_19240 [Bacteroidota bacterium]